MSMRILIAFFLFLSGSFLPILSRHSPLATRHFLIGTGPEILAAQQDAATSAAKPDEKPAAPPSARAARVTIEVAGGENNQPVENASVYLKYVEERKLKKNKTTELNVKTNREGTAHVPDTPLGRVLIQVVADGWKTYGRWYDISDANQTIKVHLEKPPKWY
jgi:hypothetical protein